MGRWGFGENVQNERPVKVGHQWPGSNNDKNLYNLKFDNRKNYNAVVIKSKILYKYEHQNKLID